MGTNTYQNEESGVDFFSAKITESVSAGTSPVMTVGQFTHKGLKKGRAIMQVDISDIPSSARIVTATLQINISTQSGATTPELLCKLSTETWVKDESDQPTWEELESGTGWATNGGSEDPARVLSLGTMPTGTGLVDLDVTWLASIAHRYKGGDFNFLLLSNGEGSANDRHFIMHSCEGGTKPLLTITYVEGNATLGKTRSTYTEKPTRGNPRKRK